MSQSEIQVCLLLHVYFVLSLDLISREPNEETVFVMDLSRGMSYSFIRDFILSFHGDFFVFASHSTSNIRVIFLINSWSLITYELYLYWNLKEGSRRRLFGEGFFHSQERESLVILWVVEKNTRNKPWTEYTGLNQMPRVSCEGNEVLCVRTAWIKFEDKEKDKQEVLSPLIWPPLVSVGRTRFRIQYLSSCWCSCAW